MKRKDKNSLLSIYETLLERFGEPIGDQPALVGAADEGPGDKALWNDKPLDREWSDPDVIHESNDLTDEELDQFSPENLKRMLNSLHDVYSKTRDDNQKKELYKAIKQVSLALARKTNQ